MTTLLQATPKDDELHTFDKSEWWAVETLWFAFTVPERNLNGVIYLVCRPSMGVCSLHINIFDHTGSEPWNQLYWRDLWTLPMPDSLSHFTMDQVGLHFEVLKPLARYHLSYKDTPEIDLTMEWDALVPPRLSNETHIDQFGRVTGTLILRGEAILIDCLQMRDRSWTTRSDLDGVDGGYSYALASANTAFLMTSLGETDTTIARGGWLLRDGEFQPIIEGRREILRRNNKKEPTALVIRGQDKAGRRFVASGQVVSRSAMFVNGNFQAWDSVVRWDLDGETCWGEDQDIWKPATWRWTFCK